MARYPTYDEYKDKPEKGIKKCDEFLKKQPRDITLLTTKLSLMNLIDDQPKAKEVVNHLVSIKPTTLDELVLVEDVVTEQAQTSQFPQPLTLGPELAKLWTDAAKMVSTVNGKLDVQSLRFSRAVFDGRLQDAQQALIQLKVLQPKNRVFYMAHAAVTQMLSTSNEDLQARLAISLARKAVSEKFDEDKELDCRVPGQIFAVQSSTADLESIKERRFKDSKQVHDTLRQRKAASTNGETISSEPNNAEAIEETKAGTPRWLDEQIANYRAQLADLFAGNQTKTVLCDWAIALYSLAAESIRTYRRAVATMDRFRYRNICDLMFVAISALVKVWDTAADYNALISAAYVGEVLLLDNKDIHEAKVILIHIYMRLDLAAQAMKHWESLSVKEVQYDTIGHIFLTRLSTTHPHKFTTVKAKHSEPHVIASNALGVYYRCDEKLAQTEASVLSNGQTGMLFDLHDLRENLRLSTTRRVISVEQRRIARLSGRTLCHSASHVSPRLPAQWLATKDNRDFKAAFDYGYNVERALHKHNEPKLWILYALAADVIWCTSNNFVPPVRDIPTLLQTLYNVLEHSPAPGSSITLEEQSAGQLAHSMLRLLVPHLKDGSVPLHSVNELAEFLSFCDSSFDDEAYYSEPFPLKLKAHYIYLDISRILAAFATYLLKHSKAPPKQALTALASAARDFAARVQENANRQILRLQSPLVKECLQENETLWTVLKDFGMDTARAFGADVAEAAKSGWKGVGMIAIS
jgi:N-terminal acetyltransferase B complex non-catalytic subunit